MTGIFINYRRDDAPGVAGRLCDHLARSFSRRELFMDVDAIKPGLDFVKQLDAQVAQCDVLLALVGPHWLRAKDEKGNRKLDGDKDYVRIEIASALQRDIPVIPVLIDGTSMPPEEDLPDDLKDLTRRHALELRHTRFAADANAIVAALKDCVPKRRKRWLWPVAAVALIGAISLGAALYSWRDLVPEETPAAGETSSATPPDKQAAIEEAKRQRMELIARRDAELAKLPPPKPIPLPTAGARVEGLRVSLGDSLEKVRSAYPDAIEGSGSQQSLRVPPSGLQFFFSDGALTNARMDAPFAGSAQGIRIGDSLADLIKALGPPHRVPWDFGGNSAHIYFFDGANIRYDIDPDGKVATIFYIRGSDAKPSRPAAARPAVEDIEVSLGDTRERVMAAYPDAETIPGSPGKPPALRLKWLGLWFFFTDSGILDNIRMDAPFSGSVQNIRIGDRSDEVLKTLGTPVKEPWEFGNNKAHLYHLIGASVRYDIDPAGKVATIFYFK